MSESRSLLCFYGSIPHLAATASLNVRGDAFLPHPSSATSPLTADRARSRNRRKRAAVCWRHAPRSDWAALRQSTGAGSGVQTTLCRPLKSTSHSSVGKPVAIVVGNRQVLPAPVANWLHRRSNTMADDFVNRLAGGAGQCTKLLFAHKGRFNACWTN
jgi:hypothetical protein